MVPLILYNFLLPFVLVCSLPRLYLKMRKRGGYGPHFLQRFGIYYGETRTALEEEKPSWWIHAVSVGEVLIALKLINEIQRREADIKLVLTTTTSTGFATAREKAPLGVVVLYNPFDLPGILHLALRFIRPKQILLTESELWPNLLTLAKRRGIPVSVVNARLSPRSERRYRKARFLVAPFLQKLSWVFAQSTEDVPRWTTIGVDSAKVLCMGSVKFDPASQGTVSEAQLTRFAAWAGELWSGGTPKRFLLLASSHAGEECEVAKVYQSLRKRRPEVRLLVVPRHFERGPEVLLELEKLGIRVQRRSLLSSGGAAEHDPDVLLIDSTGELRAWYEFAEVVLIGKSFLGGGGQNPVEPLLAGKPVICGPHMENFSPLTERLAEGGGLMQLANLSELEEGIETLLENPHKGVRMVEIARNLLREHQGATRLTVDKLGGLSSMAPNN